MARSETRLEDGVQSASTARFAGVPNFGRHLSRRAQCACYGGQRRYRATPGCQSSCAVLCPTVTQGGDVGKPDQGPCNPMCSCDTVGYYGWIVGSVLLFPIIGLFRFLAFLVSSRKPNGAADNDLLRQIKGPPRPLPVSRSVGRSVGRGLLVVISAARRLAIGAGNMHPLGGFRAGTNQYANVWTRDSFFAFFVPRDDEISANLETFVLRLIKDRNPK